MLTWAPETVVDREFLDHQGNKKCGWEMIGAADTYKPINTKIKAFWENRYKLTGTDWVRRKSSWLQQFSGSAFEQKAPKTPGVDSCPFETAGESCENHNPSSIHSRYGRSQLHSTNHA